MKRQIGLLLCVMLLLSGCAKGAKDASLTRGKGLSAVITASVSVPETVAPEGYTAVARNEKYALFADMKTGDFAIWDCEKKRFFYSGQKDVFDPENPISELNFGKVKTELVSLITVQYVQISTIASTAVPFSQNSYAYCVKKNNVKVETIKDGYRAVFTFSDIGAEVPVEITLTDTGITARIVGEKLSVGDDYRITSIDLLPGFMAGADRNDGYLFIPSGSGALIPLSSGRGETAVYRETVYGNDKAIALDESKNETRQISVPVYGIKDGDNAVFAVITQGDSTAEIAAAASSPRTSFTRVFSSYITSVIDSTTLFESNFENQRIIYGVENRKTLGDYEVQYYLLSGEDAGWVGMAKLYREQLSLKKNAKAPQLTLTVYGAAQRKANFLGIPYEENFALTSFDDAAKMLSDLSNSGVKISLNYIGWNSSGIKNKKIPVSFSPCGVLGGKNSFKNLTASLKETETAAYFDVDIMTLRKSGKGFSTYSDVCKSIFGTRTPIYQFMRSTYVPVNNQNPAYLLTPENTVAAANKFLKSADSIEGLSLGDLGSVLYSDFSAKQGREDCLTAFKQLLSDASKNHSLAFDTANSYAFQYADRICSLPMTSDGNLLFSSDVPFLQLVLHGAVSYSAESGTDLLDCISYGADPHLVAIAGDDSELIETSFNWLYGTSYKNRASEAKEAFSQYNSVYKSLYGAAIVDYIKNGDCSKTVFENGVSVLVNRGNAAATIDGVTVKPMAFTVLKEANAS